MNEPESSPSNQSKSLTNLKKDFEKISKVATSQASEVAQPDALSFDEKRQLELEREREDLDQVKRINKAQLFMLKALFVLIALWLFSVMLLTGISGFNLRGFELSDKVMITYITSTTVSVLGLFHIAARWLFSKRD